MIITMRDESGYYYQKNDVESALQKLRSAGLKNTSDAEIKSLRF